jgi:hypothetical protein
VPHLLHTIAVGDHVKFDVDKGANRDTDYEITAVTPYTVTFVESSSPYSYVYESKNFWELEPYLVEKD